MDLIAAVGNTACARHPTECVCKHPAAGKQQSAYEYGSSFARASSICTPAGRTVFVSGTAAIDARGASCHVGDVDGQTRMPVDCTAAVLDDLRCPRTDVVQAVAYCKTAEVEAHFRKRQGEMNKTNWPWIIVRGDVCRDDLLFEAEVTACVGAKPFDT
jgi:enamine deaminase RidA (YjgF/YER057c/UK114 family)